MNWVLLQNSLLVAGLTALVASGAGWMAGLFVVGLNRTWQRVFLGLGLIALALPPFVVTNTWLHYLGAGGAWRAWLAVNPFSIWGTVLILTLMFWPIAMLAAWGAWGRLEVGCVESDPAVVGWAFVKALLVPLARPMALPAAVLIFVLALNNFAVPVILQVKVFPAEMWVRFNTLFDTAGVVWLSWPLVAAPLALLWVMSRRRVPWPHWKPTASPDVFRHHLGRVWHLVAGACTMSLVVLSVGLPVFQLAATGRTWIELPTALAAGTNALWNSVWFASLTACLVLAAAYLAIPKCGREAALPRTLGWALWVPFLVPGVLLGIGLILVFNRPALSLVYQGPLIVLIALFCRYLTLSWNTVAHGCEGADRDLVELAVLNGASRWELLRAVYWPQMRRRVAVMWYIVFLLCLWDVESVVLIVPPGGETLALRIFNLLHYGHNAQVNALCLMLLVVAVTPLVVWSVVQRLRSTGLRNGTVLASLLGANALLGSGCGTGLPPDHSALKSTLFGSVQVISTRGVGVGQVNKPRSVTVDLHDNLYVVDMTGRVQKFSSNGTFALQWQMPETDIGRAKGMCRDLQGNVVVVEPHYSRVNHYTPEGRLALQWGVHGTEPGRIAFPRAAAVNTRNEIYVTEYSAAERVQRFRLPAREARGETVEFLNGFGQMGSGPGEFNRPEGIAVDRQDRVYVADSCNHRIQVFDREGRFLRAYGKAGQAPGELSYPYDICVDQEGRQYVCEFGNSRIQVFDEAGQPVEIIGGPGAGPGRFSNPWGLALDSAGNLYVADSQNHRVQKFIRRRSAGDLAALPPKESRGKVATAKTRKHTEAAMYEAGGRGV